MSFLAAPHVNVNGSGQAAGADPGMHLAQLTFLVLAEARLVFLHVPQRLPVLAQYRLCVPLGERATRLDSQVKWMILYGCCDNLTSGKICILHILKLF